MRLALLLVLAVGYGSIAPNTGKAQAAGRVTTLLSDVRGKISFSKQKVRSVLGKVGVVVLACTWLACNVPEQKPELATKDNTVAVDYSTGADTTPTYTITLNDNEAIELAPRPITLDWRGLQGELAPFTLTEETVPFPEFYHADELVLITYDNTVSIILTFDDGPDTRRGTANGTQRILDTLQHRGISAVFFIQSHARSNSNNYFRGMEKSVGIPLVEHMHDSGHIIATHTGMDAKRAHGWENRHTKREAKGALGKDLDRCNAYIKARTGDCPLYVRPPFGVYDKAVRERYASRNLRMILWDIDSRDTTRGYDKDDIQAHLQAEINRFLAQGKRELVILFHDLNSVTNTKGHLDAYLNVMMQAVFDNDLDPDLQLSKDEVQAILDEYDVLF